MQRDDETPIVSLEGHRRRKAEESRAQARAQAAKAKAVKAYHAQPYRPGIAPGEKAINWKKAPLALVAIAALFAAMWLIGRMLG